MAAMTGNAIREALEPFAKALEEAAIGTPDTVSLWFHPSAMGLTVGDLRRARTAYDAGGFGVKAEHIEAFRTVLESVLSAETSGARSPAIDFEARRFIRDHGAAILASLSPDDAADAEIGRDFLNAIEAARDEYPWLADWTPAERYGELIGDLLDIAFPGGSASSDIVRGVVRLKALEWSEPRTGPDEYKIVARLGAFEGRYEIDPPYSKGEKFRVTRPWEINPFAWALTLAEAKATAQADFERRVLSCLSTHTAAGAGPVGESVGMAGARAISNARMTSVSSVRIASDNPARIYARPVEKPAGPVGESVADARDEGWQPIETAPTGGKFGCFLMLAFGPPGDQTVSEGMHFQGRFYAASVFYTGGPHDTKQFTFREHEVKPTHWRHTLAAPGAARPVEEPGAVEMVCFQRDVLLEGSLHETARADAAEAALRETRGRLEKDREVERRNWQAKVDALNAECEATLLRAETAEIALAAREVAR